MKYILAVILSMTLLAGVYAQECEYTLTGEVLDFHDGTPLDNAVIKIADSNTYTYSDFDGKFKLGNLCNGIIKIQVFHPACESTVIPITIKGDTFKEVRLEHHVEELQEVSVTGHRKQETQTGQETILKSDDIEKYSSLALGDALKQVSGVSSLNTGNAIVKPVIQGLHSGRVPILNNGVRMEDQEWGMDHAPNIDLNSAGSITVIKGAAALQYGGEAIGGMVLVEPAPVPVKDTLYGKSILAASSNGRGIAFNTSLTKSYDQGWYLGLQGTLKKFGDFNAPDYILSNTGTAEKDFSINFGLNKFSYGFDAYYSYYNNNIGILRASDTGNVNDLINAINSKEPTYIRDFTYKIESPMQKIEHQLATFKFYKRFAELGKLDVQYDFQKNDRKEFDIRVGSDRNKPTVDLELKTQRIASSFKFDANPNLNLNLGLEGMYQTHFPDPDTGVRRLIPDYKKYGFGAFAIGNYSIGNQLIAEAGIRYDFMHIDAKKYYSKYRWEQKGYDEDYSDIIIEEVGSQYLTNPIFFYNNFSYTAGLKYSFDNAYLLRFNFVRSNRAPNPSELFSDGVHQSVASIELGDLSIIPEKSNKFSLDLQKNSGKFTFGVAPFYNPIKDFIYLEPTGVETTIRGAFPVYEYKQVNALLWGADLDASYQIDHNFLYTGRFSYVRGENSDTKEALIYIPPANTYNAITYNNLDWQNFSLTARSDFVFRQNHYPDNNFYYDVLQDGEYVSTLVDISTPPNSYFLLGLDASTSFAIQKYSSLKIGLSINNLLDVSYRDYMNRLRYYADNSGRNITLQLNFNY